MPWYSNFYYHDINYAALKKKADAHAKRGVIGFLNNLASSPTYL